MQGLVAGGVTVAMPAALATAGAALPALKHELDDAFVQGVQGLDCCGRYK